MSETYQADWPRIPAWSTDSLWFVVLYTLADEGRIDLRGLDSEAQKAVWALKTLGWNLSVAGALRHAEAFGWFQRLEELNQVIRENQDVIATPRLWTSTGNVPYTHHHLNIHDEVIW